ncbi:MAG: glycosyltransferase, partial [Gammaproteobacteria bacterium]|nr:glycosyltransferase [Gammaproteobacteria bacterium]
WIAGQGNETFYKLQARRLGISKHVTFLGTHDNIRELLLAADLLLHPAYYEAAGMVLLEAIVAGLPVLTVDTCGFAYHVKQANAGLVVSSPFQQKNLNRCLHNMLISNEHTNWSKNGVAYGKANDFYGCDTAVDIIKKIAV